MSPNTLVAATLLITTICWGIAVLVLSRSQREWRRIAEIRTEELNLALEPRDDSAVVQALNNELLRQRQLADMYKESYEDMKDIYYADAKSRRG